MRILTALLVLAVAATPAAAQRPVDPKKPAPAPAPAAPVSGYGAWFGSIPDMDNSTTGIFLNGVTAGSPAEKAGLKAGDVLLKMAGKPTIDLDAMRKWKDALVSRLTGGLADLARRRKVDVVQGVGEFVRPRALIVRGDGTETTVAF